MKKVKVPESNYGIVELYDAVATAMGYADTSELEYDCCKINIAKNIQDATTRTGVQYGNIAGVVLKDDCPAKANNYEWVVHNRIKHNTNTGKNYIVVAPISEGSNTKVTYILTNPNGVSRSITRDEAKQYTTPSYWKDGNKPAVMTIALSNILHIK